MEVVKVQTSKLKEWHMDVVVHGESSCENVVKDFLKRHKSCLAQAHEQAAAAAAGKGVGAFVEKCLVPTLAAMGMPCRARRDMGAYGGAVDGKDATGTTAKTKCTHCGEIFVKTLLCSRCKGVRYCGAECQRAAWPGHKASCTSKAGRR
jgi:hypothetical protein